LKDRPSLEAACQGIDTVITTATAAQRSGADTLECVDLEGVVHLIEAAKAAGVKRILYMSSTGTDPDSSSPFFRVKGLNEEPLRESGMLYTIPTLHIYLDIWLGVAIGLPLQAGQPITLVGQGNHRHSFIASQDVAYFAIAALEHPAAFNQTLLLGGPEPTPLTRCDGWVGGLSGQHSTRFS
jgi:uncharacterized protein YbjT (DUF2867 family)